MTQPDDFAEIEKQNHVCSLHKSIYGLNQYPREWYMRFDKFIVTSSYHRSRYDSFVDYGGSDKGGVIYLVLYVDDLLIGNRHKTEIDKLKKLLNHEFKMNDLGSAKKILGMEITRNKYAGVLFLS